MQSQKTFKKLSDIKNALKETELISYEDKETLRQKILNDSKLFNI